MLQKITVSWDSVELLRLAMSIFRGHGIMENFSSLPRLYRDAVVNELWEGPRNVLLSQIHRVLKQADPWYPTAELVSELLAGADGKLITELAEKGAHLVACPDLTEDTVKRRNTCRRWDGFCHRLFHAYQDLAVAQMSGATAFA